MPAEAKTTRRVSARQISRVTALTGCRPIVLIGLMGVGKTTVGRRLAQRLGLEFADADGEIEKAAGKSIADIFTDHGESQFRDGEQRVISRLLQSPGLVLATGGGAFMNAATRCEIARTGISVWLRADLDLLMKRVRKRSHRPLLNAGDPRGVMEKLMAERYPVYGQANVIVDSRDTSHAGVVNDVICALLSYLEGSGAPDTNTATLTGADAAGQDK